MKMLNYEFTIVCILCTFMLVLAQEEDPCDVTHGCFRQPDNCYPPSSCTYFVSWTGNADDTSLVDFELSVDVSAIGTDAYGAVGLSEDAGMPQTDIYLCRSDQTLVRYYATAKTLSSERVEETKGLANIEVDGVVDGILHCSFSRMIELSDGDSQFFSLNNSLYVLVATSTITGGNIDYHGGSNRWPSGRALDLLDTNSAGTDLKLPRARKAHGILMVIGWMFFASIGIIFARYMKPFLGDQTLFGGKVWFNIHRICMMTAFLFFAIAFIVIFSVTGEFVDSSIKSVFSHAIIGCISVSFGVLNPIMAIFRPHPGTPRRPLFNYAHRTVGILGWTFAMVAIVLATDFYFNDVPQPITDVGAFWTIIVFLIIGVVVIVTFEIVDYTISKSAGGEPRDIAMQAPGDKATSSPSPSENSVEKWRTIVFVVALLDIASCSIAMIVLIAQREI